MVWRRHAFAWRRIARTHAPLRRATSALHSAAVVRAMRRRSGSHLARDARTVRAPFFGARMVRASRAKCEPLRPQN
eukprot:9061397-Lingulodinium_polyedra.AAC.1